MMSLTDAQYLTLMAVEVQEKKGRSAGTWRRSSDPGMPCVNFKAAESLRSKGLVRFSLRFIGDYEVDLTDAGRAVLAEYRQFERASE